MTVPLKPNSDDFSVVITGPKAQVMGFEWWILVLTISEIIIFAALGFWLFMVFRKPKPQIETINNDVSLLTKDEKETKTNIKSGTYATSNVKIMGKSNNSVVCTNTKNAVSPTGVALTVAPYLVMVAAAGILAILFFRRRHGEA